MQNPTQIQPESISPLSEKEIKFSKNENVMTVLTGQLKGKYYARESSSGGCNFCHFHTNNTCCLPTVHIQDSRCLASDRKLKNYITWQTTPSPKSNWIILTPRKGKAKCQ